MHGITVSSLDDCFGLRDPNSTGFRILTGAFTSRSNRSQVEDGSGNVITTVDSASSD